MTKFAYSDLCISYSEWFRGDCSAILRHAKIAGTPSLIKNHLLCSLVILGFAKFENYLSARVSRCIKLVSDARLENRHLPCSLWIRQVDEEVLPLFKQYIIDNDEVKFHGALSSDKINDLLAKLGNGVKQELDPEKVKSGLKYPTKKNIKKLSRRIGIGDAIALLSKSARFDVGMRLDSLNDLRCEMAHEQFPASISPKDVKRYLWDLIKISMAYDKIIKWHESHVLSFGFYKGSLRGHSSIGAHKTA